MTTGYLESCSKEQLLYVIQDYHRMACLISEVCVDESKLHISSEVAIEKIRKHLLQCRYGFYNEKLSYEIDMRMGKIAPDKYRAIMLGYYDNENDE